jgi:hypothetical protein
MPDALEHVRIVEPTADLVFAHSIQETIETPQFRVLDDTEVLGRPRPGQDEVRLSRLKFCSFTENPDCGPPFPPFFFLFKTD